MIKFFFFNCFILLFTHKLYSQEIVFLDENNHPIDRVTYKKKCSEYIIKCQEYVTDSIIVNKALYKYSFGKKTSTEYHQIRNLLMRNSRQVIDSNETILVKFYDSIFSYSTIKRNRETHVIKYHLDSNGIPEYYRKQIENYTQKDYENSRNKWVKQRNKCIKKFESKYNTSIFHVYKYSEVNPAIYKDFLWIEDNGVFKNVFFQIMRHYDFLVIKSDGEFFLSGSHLSDARLKQLLSDLDWTLIKNDWDKSTQTKTKSGYGFFRKYDPDFHINHCF